MDRVTYRRLLSWVFAAPFLWGVAACSNAGKPNAPASPVAASASAPMQQWKPGSHSAAVFERLLEFRQKERDKFKALYEAYAASHGDVNCPAMTRLKDLAAKWLALTASDDANLPVYMKAFEGTGPYRRLVTKPGYSYVAGTVFLPCNATQLHPQFEVAFAYVGGWGAGDSGPAVDAGFQRSDALGNYAAFINAQGFHQISKEPRFVCGHPVEFRFYTASDRELVLWTKGLTENKRVEVVEARLQHPESYGWPANGGGPTDGIVLKRMTTIAQNDATSALPKGMPWDDDGSYFGHYANQRRPLVRWWNLVVGRVDPKGRPIDLVPWAAAESDLSAHAGSLNYPGSALVIWFTCTACPDEFDAINLTRKQ
jgi:hypothetical protein